MRLAAQSAPQNLESLQDSLLVRQCLEGNATAWSTLIDRYKNLVFSIPIKYGLSQEDAKEIFQAVWLTLVRELSAVRQPEALAGWLIRCTAHKCIRWKSQQSRFVSSEFEADDIPVEDVALPEQLLHRLEREQLLRQALAEATPECKRLINLLFFTSPPVRYDEAAETLGLAKGSIGATRMRCLEKLRRALEKKGLP